MGRGFIISALRSGEGKTLITLGLLRLLSKKGYRVQGFKIGPDFIDPKWHALASGRPSYNLDLFSMGKHRLKALFYHQSRDCDFSLVEGVMGLFDGKYSTFEVAKLLKLPIILVVDAFGMAESLSYMIEGFAEKIKRFSLPFYIFLNRLSSERHLLRIERALKKYSIIGYLFRSKDLELPSRHLGLFLPEHFQEGENLISLVADKLEKTFNFSILELLKKIPEDRETENVPLPSFLPDLRFQKIGIALDEAFNFYYPHILDELKKKATIFFFSPLRDNGLPSQIEALFFGGGYPELFAERLSENKSIIKEIKEFVEADKPVYAECGGLIYLSKGLHWEDKFYPLIGIFPFEIYKKGLTLGYRKVKLLTKHPFFGKKRVFYAHEFHYSNLKFDANQIPLKRIFKVSTQEGESFLEGFSYKKALATYMHLIACKET
ncbi:MAG: cobyrinate a,c-diamide synthase [Caldimicrobium sp.]